MIDQNKEILPGSKIIFEETEYEVVAFLKVKALSTGWYDGIAYKNSTETFCIPKWMFYKEFSIA